MSVHSKWGVKSSGEGPESASLGPASSSAPASAKAKLVLPPLDVSVVKSMLPLPSVAVHWQTHTVLQLPVSDETLCHYLAFSLAQVAPFFYY